MASDSKRDGHDDAPNAQPPRNAASGDDAPAATAGQPPVERINYLILSFASFCVIVFLVWLVSAGKRYREEYAQINDSWHVGSTRMVELTVVKEDKQALACTSPHEVAGLRCGGDQGSATDPLVLQPFNTVANQLLLGAGLWTSPDLSGTLPEGRFTVACNYTIKGVGKSVGIRFSPSAPFTPLDKTVTVGTLTECAIPR